MNIIELTESQVPSPHQDLREPPPVSEERNRAVKLLKQFDPIPRYEFDDEGYKSKMRSGLRGFGFRV